MKISSLVLAVAAAFLRSETTDLLGAADRPAPPRPDGAEPLEPARRDRAPKPRLANLRFPLFPPPLS